MDLLAALLLTSGEQALRTGGVFLAVLALWILLRGTERD